MAAMLILGLIASAWILWAILLAVFAWRIKPIQPAQPPKRFLWINIDGVDGPKTSFRNEDQG